MPALYQNLPNSPGVYLMKNSRGGIIYVGKAGNLKKRVSSYFLRANDLKMEKLVGEIAKIDFLKTDTVFEALILEANLIKKYSPYYNIKDKDDKSFLYVEITKEEFPRVILTRGKDINLTWLSQSQVKTKGDYFGPYTSASSARQALRIIRKIFPYSLHKSNKIGSAASDLIKNRKPHYRQMRSCFDYEIGLCPGTCAGFISKKDYLKNIKNIKLLFQGKKKKILADLNKEMKEAAKNLEFEKAGKFRRQIFALKHIQDISFINSDDFYNFNLDKLDKNFGYAKAEKGEIRIRIEGYDISNISGTLAVGSMVVFINGVPEKNEYRKFKIKTVFQSDDTGMLREVLERRFSRHANDWSLPNLVLIDGGKPQVNAAKDVLDSLGFKIPIIGIAKGPERKKNEFHGAIPKWTDESTLIKVRDEAHRFAIVYHKKLRGKEFIK